MKYKFVFLTFFFLLLNSCKDRCDYGEATIFFDYDLSFRVVDENDDTVIAAYRAKYSSEDTRLEASDGEILPRTRITDGGRINFIPMISEDWSELSGRDIERNFFLFLPDTSYVGGFDVDTLRIAFRAEACDIGGGCCAGFKYEYFDIAYNNKEPHHRNDTNDYYKFYLFRK